MSVVTVKSYVEYRTDSYWVEGTRISVDSVVYAFRQGLSPESIAQAFPLPNLEQIYGAIAFYLANRTAINSYLATEEAAYGTMPQPLQSSDPALYNKLIAAKVARSQVKSYH